MICNRFPEMQLESQELHIWSAYLPDNEKDIPYFSSLLSEDECQKANNFRFYKDKTNFIIARGILRCLLGRYLGLSPQEIEIVYGLWGKPCIPHHPLYFNLSHSQDYVLYAITQGYEVGIDIEYISPTLNVEEMALNILSFQELAFWKKVIPEDKIRTFFKLWVCKEAFLKASGKGWYSQQQALPPEVLEIIRGTKETGKSNRNMESAGILEFIPDYTGAFFINGPALKTTYFLK